MEMNHQSDPWQAVMRPSGRQELLAQLHPSCEGVYVGLDNQGNRHLLVQVPASARSRLLMSTRGLVAEVCELRLVGTEPHMWVDISCVLPSLNETFTLVASDLAVALAASSDDPMGAVIRTLDKWRRFWGATSLGLSLEAELGLFGELWFLDQWVPAVEGPLLWVGPTGNRHDFVSESVSVEVKTTMGTNGPITHHISSLDQMASPQNGRLLFFSLRVVQDAGARNSLNSLIDRLRLKFSGRPDLALAFESALQQANAPIAAAEAKRFRVTDQGLYDVREGFPRLTKDDINLIAPNVIDVSYGIDMSLCNDYLLARDPAAGRGTLLGL